METSVPVMISKAGQLAAPARARRSVCGALAKPCIRDMRPLQVISRHKYPPKPAHLMRSRLILVSFLLLCSPLRADPPQQNARDRIAPSPGTPGEGWGGGSP